MKKSVCVSISIPLDMIIKNLKLQNYRRFKELELELPENLIGIVGNNGTGKTTIVEAIGWVLYGNRIKRTDKQDIRSQFCNDNETCVVEMEFAIGGNEYRILRQLKGKSAITEAAVYRIGNPEPEALQERGVNDFIEQLLNLDYRSFFVSVFARQKDLAALSLLQPEERRKSIARLINIDAIENARKEIRADKNKNEAMKEGMSANIKDEAKLTANKQFLQDRLRLQHDEESRHHADVETVRGKVNNAKKNFEEISKIRDRYLHLKAQLDKWELRHSDFEKRQKKQVEQINLIKQAALELDDLKKQLHDYEIVKQQKDQLDQQSVKQAAFQAQEQERKRLVQSIEKKEIELEKLHAALQSLSDKQSYIEKIEQEFAHLEEQREAARTKLTSAQAQKEKTSVLGKEIKERQEKIHHLGKESPCPVCTRPLGEHYETVIAHFDEELNNLRSQWKTHTHEEELWKNDILQLDKQMQMVKQQRDELLRAREQFLEREKSQRKTESELTELKLTLDKINTEIAALGEVVYDDQLHHEVKSKFVRLTAIHEQALKCEENVKRLPDAEEEWQQTVHILADLQHDMKSHQEELDKLQFDEHEFQRAKNEVEELQQQFEQVRKNLEQVQREIIVLKKDIEKIDEELENQKQLIHNIKNIEEELLYLTALDQHFGIFRQELAGRIRPLIGRRASELLNLATNNRYTILELDEDYNIYLYDHTERYPLARFSGGEQDLANLCLRIAISQVVAERAGSTQINFIVLDEIFGSQDEERKELIMNTLQHLSTQFRQIFVITHVEEIKDVIPVIIHVTERDSGESTANLI